MSETTTAGTQTRFNRRAALAKLAVGGALVAAPQIVSAPAFAAASCCKHQASVTLFGNCQVNDTTAGDSCADKIVATGTICRRSTTQSVVLSRNAAGTQEPYFDELATLRITNQATNVSVTWNFVRFQTDCASGTGATQTVTLFSTADNQCNAADAGRLAIPVTDMFGSACGLFTYRLAVRNRFSPTGWSRTYLVTRYP